MSASRGIAPRNGTPSCSLIRSPPPLRKTSVSFPQCGQVNVLMFSMMPRMGTCKCLEHPEPAAGDLQTHVLRRRYDDRSGQREALSQRQLGVTSPRREVEDQGVQLAPLHAADEQVQELAHHRSTQYGGVVVSRQHAHRYHFQAVGGGGDELLVRGRRRLLTGGES